GCGAPAMGEADWTASIDPRWVKVGPPATALWSFAADHWMTGFTAGTAAPLTSARRGGLVVANGSLDLHATPAGHARSVTTIAISIIRAENDGMIDASWG